MMQQGGGSKATTTINASEDIFAAWLHRARKRLVHVLREYFDLAKGRDMVFIAVIQLSSKLSSGTGEVILTIKPSTSAWSSRSSSRSPAWSTGPGRSPCTERR